MVVDGRRWRTTNYDDYAGNHSGRKWTVGGPKSKIDFYLQRRHCRARYWILARYRLHEMTHQPPERFEVTQRMGLMESSWMLLWQSSRQGQGL